MPLPELYVAGFDTDQIWAELELQHAPLLRFADRAVRKLLKRPHKVTLPVPESDSEESDAGSDVGSDAGAGSGEDAAGGGSGSDGEDAGAGSASDGGDSGADRDGSGGGDAAGGDSDGGSGSDGSSGAGPTAEKFFSLEDMERFAAADGEAEAGIGDDINLMAPVDGDTQDGDKDPYRGPTYEDMFGSGGTAGGRRGSSGGDGGSDDDDDGSLPELDEGFGGTGTGAGAGASGSGPEEGDEDVDMAALTPYEREQLQVRRKIKELEEEALAPKPWVLTGEVKSGQRPENR